MEEKEESYWNAKDTTVFSAHKVNSVLGMSLFFHELTGQQKMLARKSK